MLDMSFGELLVIGVVALVVIGPTRLPTVARTVGRMMGRMQRYVAEVKSEVQREMDLEELRKMQSSVEDAAKSIESSVRANMDDINQEAKNLEGDWKKAEDELRHITPPATMPVVGFGHAAPDPNTAGEDAGAAAIAPTSEIDAAIASPRTVMANNDGGGQKELEFEAAARASDSLPATTSENSEVASARKRTSEQ